ncbi:hypothetical protein HPP92_000865 [Vanilla planifolia]|uniref:Cysteine-rich receptor-like protein kinase 10 n=1 Tax=Vanilla planifolia TaxID=51239 RepID=A0A835RQP9_VANPL|nr:hypothetical protein HPP92_000865 [Vanilla planifolia]
MTSFLSPKFLVLLIFVLLSDKSFESDPLYTLCLGENYTSPSPYASNLHFLLANLISQTPNDKAFYSTQRVGSDNLTASFGLAQCRLDSSPTSCADCLNRAAYIVNNSCPGNKSAFVRNELCVLRYADSLFFSVLEASSFAYLFKNNKVGNPVAFKNQVNGMLNGLIQAVMKSELKIAAGMLSISTEPNYQKLPIYGLVWCLMDISQVDCFQCLEQALNGIEGCCGDKFGAGYFTISCIVTYDDHPFFSLSLFQIGSPPERARGKEQPENPPGAGSRFNNRKKLILAISVSAAILSAFIVLCIILIGRSRLAHRSTPKCGVEEDLRAIKFVMLPFASLKSATSNFSDENKLGEGRCGPVYKGVLSDGRQIVVKRLSKASGQGLTELRNEAALVAQLQHKNLVKLLGCCIEEEEKLLVVYEYLPNASLDRHLFDPARRAQLEWKRRHAIISGIARGLVYLHNHSRVRIIHRDLNASNVLLDADMNPKIANFGLAKLVGINESQWNTKQITGTFGYMAPEYATRGLYSVKSDVFSYGMVVLEIITGRRNGSFIELGNELNLQTHVWQHWNQGKAEEIIDIGLGGVYNLEEVLRCIHICLLCLQADPMQRPSMAMVVLMLSTNTEMLSAPSLPAYFTGANPSSVSSESSSSGVSKNDLPLVDQLIASCR